MPVDTEFFRDNSLLAHLEGPALRQLAEQAQLVPLHLRDVVMRPGATLRHALFPLDGIVSLLMPLDDGKRTVEVGAVGREGVVGLSLFLGHPKATQLGLVQVEGRAVRVPAHVFEAAVHASEAFTGALHRLTHAMLVQADQGQACNRAHAPLQRCARWLLSTADRVGADNFHMTQDLLARMLGDHRPTVSRAASVLRERRLIAYSRGDIEILDREGLEAQACTCYGALRKAYGAIR